MLNSPQSIEFTHSFFLLMIRILMLRMHKQYELKYDAGMDGNSASSKLPHVWVMWIEILRFKY